MNVVGAYAGERGRRAWYRLEGRHTGMLAGRLLALAAVAIAAALVPAATLARDDQRIWAACVAAGVVQVLLWLAPRRFPTRLGALVWASIVVDGLWVTAIGTAVPPDGGPAVALFLVTSLSAAVGYSAGAGLVAGVVSSAGYIWLTDLATAAAVDHAQVAALAFFWATLGFAVLGTAAGERELRVRADRLTIQHEAGRALLVARDGAEMASVAEDAARRLLPGWTVRVRPGDAPPAVVLRRVGLDGVVVVPVRADDTAFGVIEARRPLAAGLARHTIRIREITALETLAASLAGGLDRLRLVARIQRQSLTDGLTGLPNRRAFDTELERRLAEARRSGREMALCLLDIDHFKGFNDTFGHRAGDAALAGVAELLRASCRLADIPARYGGEEMALILPDTPLTGAVDVAERLRGAIAAGRLAPRQVTVSIGVATSTGGHSAATLIEAADRALYEAKRAGRNRVAVAPASSIVV